MCNVPWLSSLPSPSWSTMRCIVTAYFKDITCTRFLYLFSCIRRNALTLKLCLPTWLYFLFPMSNYPLHLSIAFIITSSHNHHTYKIPIYNKASKPCFPRKRTLPPPPRKTQTKRHNNGYGQQWTSKCLYWLIVYVEVWRTNTLYGCCHDLCLVVH